jgi:tripartite-type tricarboxylate transporter receptor subunit TctC
MPRSRRALVSLAIASLGLAACTSPGNSGGGQAAEGEAFYDGGVLEMLVPFGPGGGGDATGRYFSQFLGNHLNGEPTFQVLNVQGGGSVTGANQYAEVVERDGNTILLSSGSTHFPYLLDEPEANYDFEQMTPLLVVNEGGVIYVRQDTGITEAAQLADPPTPLTFGGTTPTGLETVMLVALEVLGVPADVVFGYDGRGASRIALEQGETNIDFQTTSAYQSQVAPLAEAGEVIPLMTFGVLQADGTIERDPTFPDLPTVAEVAEELGSTASPGFGAYRSAVGAGLSTGKILWVHGDAPEKAQEELKEAVAALEEDEEFLAGAEELFGEYEVLTGSDAEGAVAASLTIEPEAETWLKDLLANKYGVERLN